MSTFQGRMHEYAEVSIDRFDRGNLESTAYFLSHKHEDHMQGLAADAFLYRLESNSHIHLYASDVTCRLLAADPRYARLEKFMVALDLDNPTTIEVTDNSNGKVLYKVTVTIIHASHCPGSVMFLFEGSQGTCLYTGDFRLSQSDLENFQYLHTGSRVKEIDSLYLDTTFCLPQALHIPSRDDSLEALEKLIRDWLNVSPAHMVALHYRAALGYEHVFQQLSFRFNTKLHASERTHKQCQLIPGCENITTLDPSNTRIHICKWQPGDGSDLPCRYSPPDGSEVKVCTVTLSTMWFLGRLADLPNCVIPLNKEKTRFRTCYSFHSSYSEIRQLILYLNPRKAYGNVIPSSSEGRLIHDRIKRFLEAAKAAAASSRELSSSGSVPPELGILKKRKRKQPRKRSLEISTDSESLDFGESPKKPKLAKKTEKAEKDVFHLSDLDSSQEVTTPSLNMEEEEEEEMSTDEEKGEEREQGLDIDDWEKDDEEIKAAVQHFKLCLTQVTQSENQDDSAANSSQFQVYDSEEEEGSWESQNEVTDLDNQTSERENQVSDPDNQNKMVLDKDRLSVNKFQNAFEDSESTADSNVNKVEEIPSSQEKTVDSDFDKGKSDNNDLDIVHSTSMGNSKPELLNSSSELEIDNKSENDQEKTHQTISRTSVIRENGANLQNNHQTGNGDNKKKSYDEDVIVLSDGEEDGEIKSSQDTDKTVDLSHVAGGSCAPIDLTMEEDSYHGDTEDTDAEDTGIPDRRGKGTLVLQVSPSNIQGSYLGGEKFSISMRESSPVIITVDDDEDDDVKGSVTCKNGENKTAGKDFTIDGNNKGENVESKGDDVDGCDTNKGCEDKTVGEDIIIDENNEDKTVESEDGGIKTNMSLNGADGETVESNDPNTDIKEVDITVTCNEEMGSGVKSVEGQKKIHGEVIVTTGAELSNTELEDNMTDNIDKNGESGVVPELNSGNKKHPKHNDKAETEQNKPTELNQNCLNFPQIQDTNSETEPAEQEEPNSDSEIPPTPDKSRLKLNKSILASIQRNLKEKAPSRMKKTLSFDPVS